MNVENALLYRIATAGGTIRHSVLFRKTQNLSTTKRMNTLKSLEKNGLIEIGIVAKEGKGRPPKQYRLTQDGKIKVQQLVKEGWIAEVGIL